MSDLALILSSLKSRWLSSVLSIFLTAFGVMLALLMIQFGNHVHSRLSVDGQGVDIVVGAKGSPLQLILSSVYHIDIPTGNIPYGEAMKWMAHQQVKSAIPLALGDNWRGYRIVGTTPAYMEHYSAQLGAGRIWDGSFEAVVGASVDLNIGDEFAGAHGLMAGGHSHDGDGYKVVGVMKPTGSVLDRLVLTSLDSVLELHGQKAVEHEHEHHEHEEGEHHEEEGESEITAILLTTKSPISNINLPRSINRESKLQAAVPALEMARLTSMLGLGSQSFAVLSGVLIVIASLSIFAGLAGGLENRMGDLAILRAIGYSKRRVFKIITCEGLIIVICGLILGMVMGLGGFWAMTHFIAPLRASGANISFSADFILLFLAVLLAGLGAAMWPALRASKVDVAQQLSRGI